VDRAVPGIAGIQFIGPERLKAGDEPMRVDSPGWVCPSWHDVDRDGKKDRIVGQRG
jgi:hypothetical protein